MEHKFILSEKNLDISGVKEVCSFDSKAVVLDLSDKSMTIRGENLNVGGLDIEKGILKIGGDFQSLQYGKAVAKGGFFKKIFK